MAEIVGIQLQVDPGNTEKTVGSLKQQLREATQEVAEMAEKFGATSDQAVVAAKRAAELRDAIGDARDLTESFNPDRKFAAVASALNGVTGGFAAVQGGMALLGVESQEVEKTLLKVQAAMALSQGLNSVLESKDAFVNLLTVLKQVPIVQRATAAANTLAASTMRAFGVATTQTSVAFKVLRGAIIATGIGLLVVAIGEVVAAFDEWTNAAEEAAKATQEINDKFLESAAGRLQGQMTLLKQQEALEASRLKAAGASEEQLFALQQEYARKRIAAQKAYNTEVLIFDKEAIQGQRDLYAEENALEIAQNEERARIRERDSQKAREDREKRNADAKAADEKRRQDMEEDREARKQLDLQIYEERLDFEYTRAEDAAQRQQDEFNAESQRISEHLDSVLTLIDANADAKIAIAEREREYRVRAAQGIASALMGFADLAGEQTAAGKAFAIAATTINTIQSAIAAFNSLAGIPVVGPALGTVAAAGATASGIAAVRKIVQVQVPGKGGGGSAPSISNPVAPIGATPSPLQQQVAMLDQQAINNQNNNTIRAIVVESDITDKQDRINRLHNAANFE